MGLYEDIRDADPADRQRLRAEAFAALGPQTGRSIVRGDFRLTITDGPWLVAGRRIIFSVSVVKISTGVDVTPPKLNPITVVNPPILVPDVNGAVDLGDRGKFRVDVVGCLLSILRGLV